MGNPLHQPGRDTTVWAATTLEVIDALSGTFWLEPVHAGTLGALADLGVIPRRQVRAAGDPDERITSLIAGRYCVNVGLLRALGGRNRSPVFAAKAPGAAVGVANAITRDLPEGEAWRQRSIARLDNATAGGARGNAAIARTTLTEAHAHMAAAMRRHILGAIVVWGVEAQVRALGDVDDGRPPAEVLGSLPAWRRPKARTLLAVRGKLSGLPEAGAASYLHAVDVGRAAAEVLGQELALAGSIADPGDIVHLTIDELAATGAHDWRDDVAARVAHQAQCAAYDVPPTWTGTPPQLPPSGTIDHRPAPRPLPGVVETVVRLLAGSGARA